jgi:hypothetical protein
MPCGAWKVIAHPAHPSAQKPSRPASGRSDSRYPAHFRSPKDCQAAARRVKRGRIRHGQAMHGLMRVGGNRRLSCRLAGECGWAAARTSITTRITRRAAAATLSQLIVDRRQRRRNGTTLSWRAILHWPLAITSRSTSATSSTAMRRAVCSAGCGSSAMAFEAQIRAVIR